MFRVNSNIENTKVSLVFWHRKIVQPIAIDSNRTFPNEKLQHTVLSIKGLSNGQPQNHFLVQIFGLTFPVFVPKFCHNSPMNPESPIGSFTLNQIL